MPCLSPLTVAPAVPQRPTVIGCTAETLDLWWGTGVQLRRSGLTFCFQIWLGLRLLSFPCLVYPEERIFFVPTFSHILVQYKSLGSLKNDPDKLKVVCYLWLPPATAPEQESMLYCAIFNYQSVDNLIVWCTLCSPLLLPLSKGYRSHLSSAGSTGMPFCSIAVRKC